MTRWLVAGAAALAAALGLAPVAGADGNISDTIACGFYAENEWYADTGVGYGEARKAAEDAECFVHEDPSGFGGEHEWEQEPELP